MKYLRIHADIVLYKASLFPCIYGDHSYSDGWQLWSFNKLPLKSRRKWAPQSSFPSLGVNYELADLHEHSLQLLKKLKRQGILGINQSFPEDKRTEMKTDCLLSALTVWQPGQGGWKEQRLHKVMKLSVLHSRLSHRKTNLRFESDPMWFSSSQGLWVAQASRRRKHLELVVCISHIWIVSKKLVLTQVLSKGQWVRIGSWVIFQNSRQDQRHHTDENCWVVSQRTEPHKF